MPFAHGDFAHAITTPARLVLKARRSGVDWKGTICSCRDGVNGLCGGSRFLIMTGLAELRKALGRPWIRLARVFCMAYLGDWSPGASRSFYSSNQQQLMDNFLSAKYRSRFSGRVSMGCGTADGVSIASMAPMIASTSKGSGAAV